MMDRNWKNLFGLCCLYKYFLPLQREEKKILYSLDNNESKLVFPLTMKEKIEMK